MRSRFAAVASLMLVMALCGWGFAQDTTAPKPAEKPVPAEAAKTPETPEKAPEATADKTTDTGEKTAEGDEKKGPPVVVKVGVYILSMGKLDIGTGEFVVDFYLSMKCDKGKTVPDTFEFMNGRASSMDKMIDKPDEKFYRVLATLRTPIDLKRFPFDTQTLKIIVEDKVKTIDEVVYEPMEDEFGLDPSVVFPGWEITGFKQEINTHFYKVYGESYSQYQFDVDISRMKMNSFLKTFVPVLFLMLIMTSSFILNPDQIVTRLATISSSLVAAVMFHLAISSQVPPMGYMTFADKFMGLTYLILLLSFFLNIAVFVLQSKGKKEQAQTLSTLCEKLVFIGVPVLYIGLFLFIK